MILLSDENYLLNINQESFITPSIIAKQALRILNHNLLFKTWNILDSKGNPIISKGKDVIKIRKPMRYWEGK